jgi:transposase
VFQPRFSPLKALSGCILFGGVLSFSREKTQALKFDKLFLMRRKLSKGELMSNEKDIRNLLGIKDENITFPDETATFYGKIKDVNYLHVKALLKNKPERCPHCGQSHVLVKDYYNTSIEHLSCSGQPTKVLLKRCRYCCKDCGASFVAETNFVMPNCSISKVLYLSICLELQKNISHTDIAKRLNVSVSTVQRVVKAHAVILSNRRPSLPRVLCVDEFKGPKGEMCFVACDGETSEIIAVLNYRDFLKLSHYFMRYNKKQRNAVKFLSMDMNATYNKLLKTVFTCADLIIDRFHIVQHINRNLNMLRVHLMKNFKTDSSQYRKLKKYWKLLLKDTDKISDKRFKSPQYDWQYTSQREIVDELLSFDSLLKQAYDFVVELKLAITAKDSKYFFEVLKQVPDTEISNFKNKFKVFKRFKDGVANALLHPYSNGRLEGLNNRIKVIIRTAYGYRSFVNLKARIFMQRQMFNIDLISLKGLKKALKRSEKQKATA